MSKWDKLILRIKSLDKNMRFEELQKVLEAYGYQMSSSGGSHCSFYVAIVKEIVEIDEKRAISLWVIALCFY